MRRIAVTALVAAAFVASACGGDDSNERRPATPDAQATRSATEAPASETNTPTIQEPGGDEATNNVEKVRQALEAEDYSVEDEDVSGTAEASLRVDDTSITFYKNTADASEGATGVKQAFASNPGRGSVRIKGTRLYFVGQERNLTKAERADFLKIVSIAEGAL